MPNTQHDPNSEGAEWEDNFRKQFDELKLKPPKNSMKNAERELIIWYFRNLIAQERQQAVAEFAREVVARVERMNGEPGDMGIHGGRDRLISKAAVLSILKQRGIELDQPINSIFKE